jgi:acetyl esterase/lipase
MKSRKSILFLSLAVVVSAALVFLLTTSQPFIKLIRFTIFNTFEFEGDEIGAIERDIVFKTVDGQSLMVDLYMPFEKKHPYIPVVVFSHGGGWVMGDRETMFIGSDNKQLILRLRDLGYAIANFEYRLLGEETTLADMVADNKDMVRWIRSNAVRFDFDPDNIGLWGQSAGGHLVLMAGLTDDDEFVGDEALSEVSAHVNYIVNNYGLGDLVTPYGPIASGQRPAARMETGQMEYMFESTLEEDARAFNDGLVRQSAIYYIDRNDPPVLSLHGDSDNLVNPDQSRFLQQALEKAGAAGELHMIDGADHIFNGATPEQIEEIVDLSVAFISRNTQ